MQIAKPHPAAEEHRHLRTPHSRTFKMPDGSMRCEVRPGQVHYVSDEGEMRSCDTTLKTDNGVYCEWLPYKFRLHPAGIGFTFRTREGAFASVSLVGIGGEPFNAADRLSPVINGNQITFVNVRAGCDIVFTILATQIKTLRVLHTSHAPRSFDWFCEFNEAGKVAIRDVLRGTDSLSRELDLQSSREKETTRSCLCREFWTGKTKARDSATRIKSYTDEVAYPVSIDPTVNYSISDSYDDGSETMNGGSHSGRDYYYTRLGSDSSYGINAVWRFRSVAVPQGATITSATLSLNVTGKQAAYGGGTIWGYAKDNMTSDWYSGYSNQAFVATKTAHSTTLTRPASTGIKTYDVTTIVQDIVSRAGWSTGNNVGLFALSYESTATPKKTLFEDYQAHAGNSASLSITYTASGGATAHNLLLLGCGA